MEGSEKVEGFFASLGLNLPAGTSVRYCDVINSILGSRENLDDILGGIFEEDYSGLVVEKNIPTYSYCSHHILPWFGFTHIGYKASGLVLGLSKFTRVVNYFCSGLTLQERVCESIADFFTENISPDVIVVIEAVHTCKIARGIRDSYTSTSVTGVRGSFSKNLVDNYNFYSQLYGGNRKLNGIWSVKNE